MTIHELLQAAGLTANDEIPIWDVEATGEPTKKITAQQLATAVVALANLVTGVKGNAESNYRTGNVNLTPEDIGAVKKSGDTMTGNLSINLAAIAEASYRFGTLAGSNDSYTSIDQANWGLVIYSLPIKNNSNNTIRNARFRFNEFSPNSNGTRTNYYEGYRLPIVDVGRTASIDYDILTSKNVVRIDQGGTEATTAAGARTNLDVYSTSEVDSAIDAIMPKWYTSTTSFTDACDKAGINGRGFIGEALDSIAANISSQGNDTVVTKALSTSGPWIYAMCGKNSNSYYAGMVWSYYSQSYFVEFRYSNGTYEVKVM